MERVKGREEGRGKREGGEGGGGLFDFWYLVGGCERERIYLKKKVGGLEILLLRDLRKRCKKIVNVITRGRFFFF